MASRELATIDHHRQDSCLLAMADALERNGHTIKEANAVDMSGAEATGLHPLCSIV